jgi:hypothetical protein
MYRQSFNDCPACECVGPPRLSATIDALTAVRTSGRDLVDLHKNRINATVFDAVRSILQPGKRDFVLSVAEVEHGVMGADGGEDGRALQDPPEPEHSDCDEPHEHDRPEDVANELGSLALDEEQTNEDRDGDGNDDRGECERRR